MSFGNYSFTGGHVGIAHKMSLKCTRNIAKYIPDMSPRETRPTTKQKRVHKEKRTRKKPNQITSSP